MSELEGENKVKDKNTIFDSSNIESKDKKELFTKVEGEEARKAAAEKASKAAHEKAVKEKAQEVENAEKLDKKLKKAEQESNNPSKKINNKILNFLFGGWHKWVLLALTIVIAGAIFFFINKTQNSDEAIFERDEAASVLADSKYSEAERQRLGGSFDNAKKVFEDALKGCNREEKIYLTVRYARYIAQHQYDSERAYALISGVESEAKTDLEREVIQNGYYYVEVYTGDKYEK